MPCGADNIVVTSGSQQGLDYLGKLFLSPGDTALVGWPTYLGALQAFNAYEPRYDRLEPEHGNTTPAAYRAAAEAAGSRVRLAYLTPDFANPSGETLSLAARERALALADELDIPLVEDSAYQALRYDGDGRAAAAGAGRRGQGRHRPQPRDPLRQLLEDPGAGPAHRLDLRRRAAWCRSWC